MKPYYDHGGIVIYHGDCREILPALPAVDLLLTDPPYGVNLGNHGGARDGRPDHVLVKGCYESYDDTLDNLRVVVVPAIRSAVGMATRGIVFCAGQHVGEFPKPSSHRTTTGKGYRLEKGSKATVYSSVEASEKNGHPCPKPIGSMLYFVGMASGQGDIVLDPFMGSGTTLVACKRLGRRGIGIEIEEKYCETAARRVEAERLTLFEHAGIEQGSLDMATG